MADFAEQEAGKSCEVTEHEESASISRDEISCGVAQKEPLTVVYCPVCSLPPEFCEFGPSFSECLHWILKNCPDVLSEEVLASMVGETSLEEETEGKSKKKRGGGGGPKKKATVETKVIIAKIQRQKKKFVTAIAGLETVPELKLKDACKVFGKKFSSGASITETAGGNKEVVIQGDVIFELPQLLINEFKVDASTIFILEDKSLRPYVQ